MNCRDRVRERCCSVSPTHIPQRSCYGGVPSRYDISVKTGGLGVSGGDNFISSIPSFSEHWFFSSGKWQGKNNKSYFKALENAYERVFF